MANRVPFEQLVDADLHVDRIYEGGRVGNAVDDPLQRLLPVGNQGGFRYSGSRRRDQIRLIVLYTTGADRDWPDSLDMFTGTFTYFGDNKRPGHELHDTPRGGNAILRWLFDRTRDSTAPRADVPPVLVFSKGDQGRDVVFRGLAVPGSPAVAPGDDLIAVWRTSGDRRFQNYRATFTILDVEAVQRHWINAALKGGRGAHEHAGGVVRPGRDGEAAQRPTGRPAGSSAARRHAAWRSRLRGSASPTTLGISSPRGCSSLHLTLIDNCV
jgi:Restriction endonuclease AspBHI N-terminal